VASEQCNAAERIDRSEQIFCLGDLSEDIHQITMVFVEYKKVSIAMMKNFGSLRI
jgi:hypothetical protein